MSRSLHELGKFAREQAEDETRSREVISGAKERFIESVQARETGGGAFWFLSGSRRPALVLAGALVVAIGLGAAWGVSRWDVVGAGPLRVALEEQPVELIGRWVRSGVETKQLSFSDGTKLSLHPETELRVAQTTSNGATIELGRGRTLAQIEPKNGASWDFRAGPFSVKVTGTEFDLAWDPEKRVLELALHQGSVLLSGPSVDGERAVRKGEFVRVALPGSSEEAHRDEDGESADLDEVDDRGADEVDGDGEASQGEPGGNSDAPVSGWRAELQSGAPRDAIAAIEKAGRGSVLSAASSEELWQLARVARLGGAPALARDALLALRERHGTRGQTSYLLGKVHADQLGATSEAIKWFEIYLKEAPGGSLAEQAMGRVVELQVGSRAGKRAARRYLDRYPNGSYADFCRSQLR